MSNYPDFTKSLHEWSENEGIMKNDESRKLELCLYSYNYKFWAMQVAWSAVMLAIANIIVICNDFEITKCQYIILQFVIVLAVTLRFMFSKNMQRLLTVSNDDLKKNAYRLLRISILIGASIVFIQSVAIHLSFGQDGDYIVRQFGTVFTFACMTLAVYAVVFFVFEHLAGIISKGNPCAFIVNSEETKLFTKFKLRDIGISADMPYIGNYHSIFIKENNGHIGWMNFQEGESLYNITLLGRECVVKIGGYYDIKQVYDCDYIIVRTLEEKYKKWFYTSGKQWVEEDYNPTPDECRIMEAVCNL